MRKLLITIFILLFFINTTEAFEWTYVDVANPDTNYINVNPISLFSNGGLDGYFVSATDTITIYCISGCADSDIMIRQMDTGYLPLNTITDNNKPSCSICNQVNIGVLTEGVNILDYTTIRGYNDEYLIRNYGISFVEINMSVSSPEYNKIYSMSSPYVEGNYIKSKYNISVVLWSNPYFVWGSYNSNGTIIKKACAYQVNNIFACDLIEGSYSFNMSYSSYNDYNNSRIFYTDNIYIVNGQINDISNISRLPQNTREVTTKNNIWDYVFLIFLIIGILYLLSFNDKRRPLKIYER